MPRCRTYTIWVIVGLVMLMVGGQSIRDVIAFPKTQSAQCVMTEAPGQVSERQLRELSLRPRRTEQLAAE